MTPDESRQLEDFLIAVIGAEKGYVCVAWGPPNDKDKFQQQFFNWPSGRKNIIRHIDKVSVGNNVWFCPQLFSVKVRKKENVIGVQCVWADLDTCPPDVIDPKPPIVLVSSPHRYQAFWPAADFMPPQVAQDYARRIAYTYAERGVDKSGWDLTQLLRVPFTFNYKPEYSANGHGPPQVEILRLMNIPVHEQLFLQHPEISGTSFDRKSLPDNLPDDIEVLEKYKRQLPTKFFTLRNVTPTPDDDWSVLLWQLMMFCFEAGMSEEEVFVICNTAECNKFNRDNKPDLYLWYDVLRASKASEAGTHAAPDLRSVEIPELFTEDESHSAHSFVDAYVDWAIDQTDAAEQYHEVSSFMILSSLLSGTISLKTGFGKIIPNIWVMLIADTTLTRKTTAMDMAMDLLTEPGINEDAVLATDGSIEGIFQTMSARNGVPSIFLRDEFTGLMESVAKKDYMAGTLESFTKLYDGKYQKRVLKKEEVVLTHPIFLIFAGSIRKKLFGILTDQHIHSGFLPRFIFVTAESDPDKMGDVGPPTEISTEKRQKLIEWLMKLKDAYVTPRVMRLPDGQEVMNPPQIEAFLPQNAWQRYNKLEKTLVNAGVKSSNPEVFTPLFDRLSKTTLKLAILIAASRQIEEKASSTIEVSIEDVVAAIRYTAKWIWHTVEIAENVGKTPLERTLERVVHYVEREPGASRGIIMRNMKIHAGELNLIEATLEQRGMIRVVRKGKAVFYWPHL